MTNEQHPIIPPTKLVELWRADASNIPVTYSTDSGGRRDYIDFIATAAAQWGADQELESCVKYFHEYDSSWGENSELITGLRATRRPKPPSLKEQALAALRQVGNCEEVDNATFDTIRRALETL